MNIFLEMGISLWNFDYYPNFLKNRRGKVIAFAAVLMLIPFLLGVCFPFFQLVRGQGGYAGIIQKYVPDFTFANGKLETSSRYHLERGGIYIDVNTDAANKLSEDDASVKTAFQLNSLVFIANSERAIIRGAGNRIDNIPFSMFAGETFSKAELVNAIPFLRVLTAVSLVFSYLFSLVSFFFQLIFVALFGMMIASMKNVRIRFGQIYRMSVYTRTLPVIISLANYYLPVASYGSVIVMFTVSIVFLWVILSRQSGRDFTIEQRNADRSYHQTFGRQPGSGQPANGSGQQPGTPQGQYTIGPIYPEVRTEENSNPAGVAPDGSIRPSDGWSFGHAGGSTAGTSVQAPGNGTPDRKTPDGSSSGYGQGGSGSSGYGQNGSIHSGNGQGGTQDLDGQDAGQPTPDFKSPDDDGGGQFHG